MTVECFLDTNILVYAAGNHPAEAEKKRSALALMEPETFGTSAQVLQEFYVTTTLKIRKPLSPKQALDWLAIVAERPCVPVDFSLMRSAAALAQRFRISYWDGAILAAAEALGADRVFTEDLNHGQRYGTVTVINPFR